MKNSFVWRSRWAAIGAAVAVSLGGGGFFLANAAPGPSESTIVNVTPTRVLDTRDPVNLGLPGPFTSPTSQKLQITGNVPTSGGNAVVVPVGATGVLLNVTAVSPQAAGFVSIRPGDAVGAPTTSSLNVEAGSNIPNAVQVSLPTTGADAGKIDITYDAYGVAGRTTELLVDIVGYTTNTGLQELVRDVPTVAYSGGNQFTSAPTTSAVMRSVTMTPPSDGTVMVSSTAGALVGTDFVQCSITTGNAIDSNFNQIVDGANAGDRVSLSGIRAFDAVANVAITVNLVCRGGVGAVSIFDSNMSAEFFASDGVVADVAGDGMGSPEEG